MGRHVGVRASPQRVRQQLLFRSFEKPKAGF